MWVACDDIVSPGLLRKLAEETAEGNCPISEVAFAGDLSTEHYSA